MIKKIYLFIILSILAIAQDNIIAKQQDVLYVQNLISIEENISDKFEKYLLTEFKIPSLEDLSSDDYLGSNFSIRNRMGSDISFKDINNLQIKYAITEDVKIYVKQLYNRDLYRMKTSAFEDSTTPSDSYVLIKLQSEEAINIFDLLKNGNTISKSCTDTLINMYCNNNKRTLRWYNSVSNWIEYDKVEFERGNVTVKNEVTLNDTKLNNLVIGARIFVQNTSKYIKLINNEILKVD